MFGIYVDKSIEFTDKPVQGNGYLLFETEADLRAIADREIWSKKYLTDIWNLFAGTPGPFSDLKPQKMFKNRPYGVSAIWKVIQRLDPSHASAGEPESAQPPIVQTVAKVKAKKVKVKKVASVKKQSKQSAKSTKPRTGNKRDEVIRLISRAQGATIGEIMEKMGWKPHSTRGFISTLQSKHGVKIASTKHPVSGERLYCAA